MDALEAVLKKFSKNPPSFKCSETTYSSLSVAALQPSISKNFFTVEIALDIVRKNGSVSRFMQKARWFFTDAIYEPTITSLDQVKSMRQGTRVT